ncbi:hypothetical protein HN011_005281 [Eciton burchellii]|nr:hypothetical protein HN011_005281 [Eciton burchellii]
MQDACPRDGMPEECRHRRALKGAKDPCGSRRMTLIGEGMRPLSVYEFFTIFLRQFQSDWYTCSIKKRRLGYDLSLHHEYDSGGGFPELQCYHSMVQEVEERRRRTLIGVTVEIDGESIKVGGF